MIRFDRATAFAVAAALTTTTAPLAIAGEVPSTTGDGLLEVRYELLPPTGEEVSLNQPVQGQGLLASDVSSDGVSNVTYAVEEPQTAPSQVGRLEEPIVIGVKAMRRAQVA